MPPVITASAVFSHHGCINRGCMSNSDSAPFSIDHCLCALQRVATAAWTLRESLT